MAREAGQRRADYILYIWQIRAIRALARERGRTPSAVVRELLAVALGGAADKDVAPPPMGS